MKNKEKLYSNEARFENELRESRGTRRIGGARRTRGFLLWNGAMNAVPKPLPHAPGARITMVYTNSWPLLSPKKAYENNVL